MFGAGWTEMLIIGIVALVVIGPKDLPVVMRKLGRVVRTVRRMGEEFQSELSKTTGLDQITDLKRSITEPLREFNRQTTTGVEPTGIMKPTDPKVESVYDQIAATSGLPLNTATSSVIAETLPAPAEAASAAPSEALPAPAEAAPSIAKARKARKTAVKATPDAIPVPEPVAEIPVPVTAAPAAVTDAAKPVAKAHTPRPRKPAAAEPVATSLPAPPAIPTATKRAPRRAAAAQAATRPAEKA
jgi:sec-independent protein translocase protein TatB